MLKTSKLPSALSETILIPFLCTVPVLQNSCKRSKKETLIYRTLRNSIDGKDIFSKATNVTYLRQSMKEWTKEYL